MGILDEFWEVRMEVVDVADDSVMYLARESGTNVELAMRF